MRILSVLALPLLAGCAALKEVGNTVASAGGVLLDGAGNLTGIGEETVEAVVSGSGEGILSAMTMFGIPPYITGPLGLLLAIKRSRGHLMGAGASLLKSVGLKHSSDASEKAADK